MKEFDRLVDIMETLRAPGGCPWDAEQTHRSIAGNAIEEAYELADAIDRDDTDAMLEELGDVLLQVVFHSTMAREEGRFDVKDVVNCLCDKLVYRHPHVFGSEQADGAGGVIRNWERLKRREKGKKERESIFSGIPDSLPAVLHALKIQSVASRAGFDWESGEQVLDKLEEELSELQEASALEDSRKMEDEIGDLIFSLVNLARKLGLDPEAGLRRTSRKFVQRFREIEKEAARSGRSPEDMPMDEKEKIWQGAKTAE